MQKGDAAGKWRFTAVSGLPIVPADGLGTKGIVCITNDGNMWIDTNSADGVCN